LCPHTISSITAKRYWLTISTASWAQRKRHGILLPVKEGAIYKQDVMPVSKLVEDAVREKAKRMMGSEGWVK